MKTVQTWQAMNQLAVGLANYAQFRRPDGGAGNWYSLTGRSLRNELSFDEYTPEWDEVKYKWVLKL